MESGDSPASSRVRYIRSRTANACDGCKARKVKCDGKLPCGYCAGRRRQESCHYSQQAGRRRRVSNSRPSPSSSHTPRESRVQSRAQSNHHAHPTPALPPSGPASSSSAIPSASRTRAHDRVPSETTRQPPPTQEAPAAALPSGPTSSSTPVTPATVDAPGHPHQAGALADPGHPLDTSAEDETDVPREARLLCDAHGKLIFIGDCAPLSFFQSVRQLVTTRVAHNAFAPQTSRYSVLENAPPRTASSRPNGYSRPDVTAADVVTAVPAYISATTSLVDLFDNERLLDDLMLWADLDHKPDDITSVVHFLVLAIGHQMDDEELSRTCFEYARDRAYGCLSGDFGTGTVQAFTLITVYMLCSCQINGAFLFFGVAVRAAYSVGVHRTEVNARFGPDIHRQRDRLWKSLRIVDLFLSVSMGRPPSTSDVDCTVPYRSIDGDGNEAWDLLNASVQILLITEVIVVEVYSRRKISLQLTEGISRQLRDWSARWVQPLKDVVAQPALKRDGQAVGACQVLSSYYYAVMLVSRPFLMYELVRRLGDGSPSIGRSSLPSGKSKLADACIDAASLMIDPILDLIERDAMNGRYPLLISWLFASSLVLGVGLLGGFGRILEKCTRMSIQALDYFSKNDGHARQYSLIAQSLLTTALEHLERSELQERLKRTESSSQLFGLIPGSSRLTSDSPSQQTYADRVASARSPAASMSRGRDSLERTPLQHYGLHGMGTPRLGDIDSAFLGLSESLMQTPDTDYWNGFGNEGDTGSALNLFPLLEAGGGIDLAHYL